MRGGFNIIMGSQLFKYTVRYTGVSLMASQARAYHIRGWVCEIENHIHRIYPFCYLT